MKEKKHLDALYYFGDEEIVEEEVEIEKNAESADSVFTEENASDGESSCEQKIVHTYTKPSELRTLTYKIEDNTAEMMNYNAIIESSKKTLKSAKKDYAKAKKEYDSKSFGALIYKIITFLGAFFSVYFLVKWYGDKESSVMKISLYSSLGITALFLLISLYQSYKLRPLKKKMKRAKDLVRDSKTWIDESERGMRLVENENDSLKRQKKNM